ncbi:PAS domain-containing protein [Parvibaculum sp.]|uniref:PAS domain-containing protein n=1 Tax=Parvibaculum sp. TaxID=2024848 RepID=UPI0032997F92
MPVSGGARPAPIELPPIALDAELEFSSSALADGLAYWNKQAEGRQMPLLADIRPEEIVSLLPFLSLFEIRTQDGVFSIFPRLAGAKFEEVFGQIHKKELHTVLPPEILERWHGAARTMVEAGVPLRATGQVLHEDRSFITFELLLAPLSRTGDEIDILYLLSDFGMPSLSG